MITTKTLEYGTTGDLDIMQNDSKSFKAPNSLFLIIWSGVDASNYLEKVEVVASRDFCNSSIISRETLRAFLG